MKFSEHLLVLMLAGLVAVPGVAVASPIDNPCTGLNCDFLFNQNGSQPFFEFANGQTITDLSLQSAFTANTTSAGATTITGSFMQAHPTSVSFSFIPIYMQLTFSTGSIGTTDLSGSNADVDWAITATASFIHGPLGLDAGNCTTGTFVIDIDGDWDDVDSSAFEIPAFASTACNNNGTLMNLLYGLGDDGAILTLYKFSAYNGANPLTGS